MKTTVFMKTMLFNDVYKVKDIIKNARYDANIRITKYNENASETEKYTLLYNGKVYGLYDAMEQEYHGRRNNNIVCYKIKEIDFSYDGIFISVYSN